MPAVSEKQRELFAIAEHAPSKLLPKNRSLLSMSRSQLHDFAATKGLGHGTKTLLSGKSKAKAKASPVRKASGLGSFKPFKAFK